MCVICPAMVLKLLWKCLPLIGKSIREVLLSLEPFFLLIRNPSHCTFILIVLVTNLIILEEAPSMGFNKIMTPIH